MCACVVIPFILDVRFVDVPVGVTQEEGHTGLVYLPPAVVRLIFLARRIQPFLSLVDCKVEFCVLTILIGLHLLGMATTRFELKCQRQKVSRLSTELPGRPAVQKSFIFFIQ